MTIPVEWLRLAFTLYNACAMAVTFCVLIRILGGWLDGGGGRGRMVTENDLDFHLRFLGARAHTGPFVPLPEDPRPPIRREAPLVMEYDGYAVSSEPPVPAHLAYLPKGWSTMNDDNRSAPAPMTDRGLFRARPGINYRSLKDAGTIRVEPIVMHRVIGEPRVNIPHTLRYHSPTGFEWGYGGSGPAELALNILGLVLAPPEAFRLHQDYKREVIARVPAEAGGVILMEEVVSWILECWREEDEADEEEYDHSKLYGGPRRDEAGEEGE